MPKDKGRPTLGSNGLPLSVLPLERDAKLIRVMFYTPGFMALLLLKTGSKPVDWVINGSVFALIVAACVANLQADYDTRRPQKGAKA